MKSAILAAVAAALLSPTIAFAHASLAQAEAENGSYIAVLRIPHGCEGKATNTVTIEMPEGFIGAKPMPKAGWNIVLQKGDYAKTYTNHGSEVKSGLTSVTWSGGNLPDDQFDEFTVRGTLSGLEPGSIVYFKTTQLCEGGQVAWVDIPAEGQDSHGLKFPAPALTIAASKTTEHSGHSMAASTAIVGDMTIGGFWARAMLPNQPVAGGFLSITNKGAVDSLIMASSPRAGRVELHEMLMNGDVMEMREVKGGIVIPAGATIELKPGGLHVMFFDIVERFEEGQTVPVTLTFEKAGTVELMLPVLSKQMGGMEHGGAKHDHMKHGG